MKQAVFAAGGGRVGRYDSCCWQVLGQGQFRALEGSQPFLGQIDSDTVELHLADAGAPTLIRENEQARALYVLMPMRV